MTDHQAFEMGLRWLAAGFKAPINSPGAWTRHLRGIIPFTFSPDPRDPGNKSHAVAQLRERLKDPYVCLIFRFDGAEWHIDTTEHDDFVKEDTEEDCITVALEAAKP